MALNLFYPAIFTKEEEGYIVTFPDLKGCITDGNSLEDAYLNAQDALNLFLDDLQEIPQSSKCSDINKNDDDYVMLVSPSKSRITHFYPNLKALIDEALATKKISRYRLAKEINISESYLSKIYQGKRVPTPEIAKKISDVLNIPWEIFYDSMN